MIASMSTRWGGRNDFKHINDVDDNTTDGNNKDGDDSAANDAKMNDEVDDYVVSEDVDVENATLTMRSCDDDGYVSGKMTHQSRHNPHMHTNITHSLTKKPNSNLISKYSWFHFVKILLV